MRCQIASLMILTFFTTTAATGQDSENSEQLCNLQGRELALRTTENLLPELDQSGREALAELAKNTCLDFAEMWSREMSTPDRQESSATDGSGETQNSSGLFDDIRVIAPQERVRRPGLKRP